MREWEQRRKASATSEIEIAERSTKLKYLQEEEAKLKGESAAMATSIKEISSRITALSKSKAGFASRKIEIEKQKDALKAECEGIYSSLNRQPGGRRSGDEQKRDSDRARSLRDGIEGRKVKLGSIEKENEMREERLKQITKELKEEEASIKSS